MQGPAMGRLRIRLVMSLTCQRYLSDSFAIGVAEAQLSLDVLCQAGVHAYPVSDWI